MSKLVRAKIGEGLSPPDKDKDPRAWSALVSSVEAELGRPICAARKRTKWPCEAGAMKNGRCRIHGGKALSGPAHPHFKHGRYAKSLDGTYLATVYQEAKNDPGLLQLTDEIALTVARVQQLVDRLPSGDSRSLWSSLAIAVRKVRAQFLVLDMDELPEEAQAASDYLAEVEHLVATGGAEYAVWEEILVVQQHLRSLVDTERKYREGLKTNVPAERVTMMFALVLDSLRRHVEPNTLQAVLYDLRQARSSGREVGVR